MTIKKLMMGAGAIAGPQVIAPSSNDWDYTFNSSWSVAGNTLGDHTIGGFANFGGGSVPKHLSSLPTFDGDFEIEFDYITNHESWFGVYAINEDAGRDTGDTMGLDAMTNSFFYYDAGTPDFHYGSASVGNHTFAEPSNVKITRISGEIKVYDDDSLAHTFSTSYSDPMRFTFGGDGNSALNIDNILFTDTDKVQRDGFYDETQYNSSALGNYASGSIHVARRWIATRTGTLASLSFEVRTVTTGSNFHVELWSGTMTSPASKVGGDTNTINITSTGKKTFTFSTKPDVTKGQVYWAVIEDEDHASTNANIALWEIRKADIQDSGAGHNDTVTSITDSNSTAGVAAVYQMEAVINATGEPTPDHDTLLLIHSNTSGGSTSFTDSSQSGRTVSVNGNTNHSTTQKKFGTTSMYFDGTGDYLTVPDSDDWLFNGTGDFTIEFWMYTADTTSRTTILRKGRDGPWGTIEWGFFMMDSVNKVTFQFSNNGSSGINLASSTSINDSAWHHIAVTRRRNKFELYVDGTSEANQTAAYSARNDSTVLAIGAQSDGASPTTCYLDEVRISRVARWDANFTAPSAAYP